LAGTMTNDGFGKFPHVAHKYIAYYFCSILCQQGCRRKIIYLSGAAGALKIASECAKFVLHAGAKI
jgi:hypothetical protein